MDQNIQSNFLECAGTRRVGLKCNTACSKKISVSKPIHVNVIKKYMKSQSAWDSNKKSSIHSQCGGCAWRFRQRSRSRQRIQNPGGRWIHRGGGPSSRGVGEAWEGCPPNGESQVSLTLSSCFQNTISE